MQNTDFMAVFDVIIMVYGIYTIYATMKMKKTGELVKWLIAEQELYKCRDVKAFIESIYPQTIGLGIGAVFYGIASMLNRYWLKIVILDTVFIIIFIIACGIYMAALKKVKEKFF